MKKKNTKNPRILLLGKTPPPYMGPAIATQIILNSSLNKHFRLIHVETRLNHNLTDMGSLSLLKVIRLFYQYINFLVKLALCAPLLVVVPVSQSYSGFMKDAMFVRLAFRFRKKVVIHLRGSNFLNFYQGESTERRAFIDHIIHKAFGVIVLGGNLRYIFEPFFPSEKIYVVPNGADYPYFLPAINLGKIGHSLSLGLRLLYLGNLQPTKGIMDVIEAFTQLQTSKDLLLNVVGQWRDEETKDKVFQILTDSKYKPVMPGPDPSSITFLLNTSWQAVSKVVFHSARYGREKLDILNTSDVFLFPPRGPEGHPWVIIEAMAAGLPIISTDQGAITESVIDGVNGFIVEKQNPKAIAEKIRYLIEHPDIRDKMGRESRRLYEENFTEEKMVERLKGVFDRVIDMNN